MKKGDFNFMEPFQTVAEWKHYFANAVRIAQEQDYLSDADWFDMGLGDAIHDCGEDEDAQKRVTNRFYEEKRAMFKALFGEDFYD